MRVFAVQRSLYTEAAAAAAAGQERTGTPARRDNDP